MDAVSCVSCVSWKYSVNAAETYETDSWESDMRYHYDMWWWESEMPTRCCGLHLIAITVEPLWEPVSPVDSGQQCGYA